MAISVKRMLWGFGIALSLAAPAVRAEVTEAQCAISKGPGLPATDVTKTDPGIDAFFPPASQRLGEEGQVDLYILLSPAGQVVDTGLIQSSGHARLDRAANDFVTHGLHFEKVRSKEAVCGVYHVIFRFKQ